MAKTRNVVDQVEFMRNMLAFLLIGAFIGAVGVFTFIAIPKENKDIITYMVGQLSGMALTVLGFYFINKVGADALDAKRAENTGVLASLATKALDAGVPTEDKVASAVDETAQAAVDKADDLKGENK